MFEYYLRGPHFSKNSEIQNVEWNTKANANRINFQAGLQKDSTSGT